MGDTFNVTHEQLEKLLAVATDIRWPAKLGTPNSQFALEFDDQERAANMRNISALWSAISGKYSTQKGLQICVGDPKNWREIPIPKKSNGNGHKDPIPSRIPDLEAQPEFYYMLKDPKLAIEVELEGCEQLGAYCCCLMMMHPASPYLQQVGIQAKVIQPLVDLLGMKNELLYDLGLIEKMPEDEILKGLK